MSRTQTPTSPGDHTRSVVVTPDTDVLDALLEQVGAVLDCPREELPILAEHVDPDALEALIAPTPATDGEFSGTVSLAYGPHLVTIRRTPRPTTGRSPEPAADLEISVTPDPTT